MCEQPNYFETGHCLNSSRIQLQTLQALNLNELEQLNRMVVD